MLPEAELVLTLKHMNPEKFPLLPHDKWNMELPEEFFSLFIYMDTYTLEISILVKVYQ